VLIFELFDRVQKANGIIGKELFEVDHQYMTGVPIATLEEIGRMSII